MMLGHVVGGLALFGGSILAATMAVALAGMSGMRHLRKPGLRDVARRVVTAGAEAEPHAPLTRQRSARRPRNGQETAAFTSSATFFSTMGLHFLSAYDTGHTSPSSRLAASWKPRVEYR